MSDDIVVIAGMSVSLACRRFRAGSSSGCDVMLLNMKEKMRVRSGFDDTRHDSRKYISNMWRNRNMER